MVLCKVPKHIEFKAFLPKNATGNILKRILILQE
jgi:acyl-coenzyme A synthetase/AMP-(fatty) acid ligase